MSGKKTIWTVIITALVLIIVIVITASTVKIAKLENNQLMQNYGTTKIATPAYYIDPRTKNCFAMFPNGGVASVKCDDLVKSLMMNDWINKE